MTAKQSRPEPESEAANNAQATHSLAGLDALAERVGGAFVLLVKLTPPNRPAALPEAAPERPKYRRRVFMSAAAAERAVRAAAARGESCRVYLAELAPLHLVRGWEA